MTVQNMPFAFTFGCMNTDCSLQIYAENADFAESVAKKVEANTRLLEDKYNFHNDNSYLNQLINNRNTSIIEVDKETANVLQKVRQITIQTNKMFDITVGTFKHCLKLDNTDEHQSCITQLIDKTGFDAWNIKGQSLEFLYPETKLDLGGVIKEYAVDRAVDILKGSGIESAIINFGGDLYALGKKPDGELFIIGIKNPENPKQTLIKVQIENKALTTSAHYERSHTVGKKEFSHILQPEANDKKINEAATNDNKLLSATIISDSVLTSGIYSTSLMLDSTITLEDDIKALLVDKELRVHQNIM